MSTGTRPLAPASLSVRSFRDSLGTEYAERYDAGTVAIHAEIAARRGATRVSLGTFELPHRREVGVCVVAVDAPGLLATVTAAFVACGFDISSAEAYTRRNETGQSEAVDIFWVTSPASRQAKKFTDVELEELRTTLTDMLRSEEGPPPQAPLATSPPAETVIRFLESADGTFTTLEVETDDRSGLLLALASALFASRVQINSSQVRTEGQRVYDRFNIVEVDGSPISAERRLEIQVAVLGAVDPNLT